MTCTLSKTLEVLDEKIAKLKSNIKDCREEAKACSDELREVKKLITEIKSKRNNEPDKEGFWYQVK